MYNIDMEEQHGLDLIKEIKETKDGEVGVVQTLFELIATTSMYD